MNRRIRIGCLAQEDCYLPLEATRGSIDNDISQLSSRLKDRCDMLIATRPHPTLGMDPVTLNGIRYVRADIRSDLRRGRIVHRLNQAQRLLGLRDLPYAGRASYFRSYVRQHLEHFRQAKVDIVHLHNTSQ